jgi:hypothetical protein
VHVVDALAITGEEGRGSLRKAPGSWQTSFDPGMSEWGNPAHTSLAFARTAVACKSRLLFKRAELAEIERANRVWATPT